MKYRGALLAVLRTAGGKSSLLPRERYGFVGSHLCDTRKGIARQRNLDDSIFPFRQKGGNGRSVGVAGRLRRVGVAHFSVFEWGLKRLPGALRRGFEVLIFYE